MLVLHILIALTSIVLSGINFARPSAGLLRASYALTAATLASGTYLVVMAPAHLASACVSGLAYLAMVGTATVMARAKLAHQSDQ